MKRRKLSPSTPDEGSGTLGVALIQEGRLAPRRGTEETQAARALIDAAGTLLRAERGDMPAGFVSLLFARTAPEDLIADRAA